MPKYISIKKPNQAVSVGDMRDSIIIYNQAITAPSGSNIDFTENFVMFKNVKSLVIVKSGEEIFDKSNLLTIATHFIYIRWFPELTAEYWIQYRSDFYDILDIENLDERNRFYLLKCKLRGDVSEPVNYA